MRTRNRGQRTSFVSSLGLCPKANIRRSSKNLQKQIKIAKRGREISTTKMNSVACINRTVGVRPTSYEPSKLSKRLVNKDIHTTRTKRQEALEKKELSTPTTTPTTPEKQIPDPILVHGRKRRLSSGSERVFHSRISSISSRTRAIRVESGSDSIKDVEIVPKEEMEKKVDSKPVRSYNSRASSKSQTEESNACKSTRTTKSMGRQMETPSPSKKKEPKDSRKSTSDESIKPSINRGRPRKCQTSSEIKSSSKDDTKQEEREGQTACPNPTSEEQRVTQSRSMKFSNNPRCFTPSKLLNSDIMSSNGGCRFGSNDEVLQKILGEVNSNGSISSSTEPYDLNKEKPYDLRDIYANDKTQLYFEVPIVSTVFEAIQKNQDSLIRIETKDLFLALNGLLRPGVCELWRHRREDQTKQLSRNIMGRLRPNPRPRRYSDMVVPLGTVVDSHFADKHRQGPRSLAFSAARLTAVKRLNRARVRHIATPMASFVITKPKPSRNDRKSNSRSTAKLPKLTVRQGPSCRRSSRLPPQLALTTRTRRRPDVSHHIDWKFCYASTEKETGPMTSGFALTRRRRKAPLEIQKEPTEDEASDVQSIPSQTTVFEEDEMPKEECHSPDVPQESTISSAIVESKEKSEISPDKKPEMSAAIIKPESAFVSRHRNDEQRKRRHALTVQRKRPVDRLAPGLRRKVPDYWQTDRAYSAQLDEESSNSSCASVVSGATDILRRESHVRSFQQRTVVKPRALTPPRKLTHDPSTTISGAKLSRSLNAHRSRHQSGSMSLSRRANLPVRIAPPLSPRQRITRRPDRMCQLTLLDRLVLGLNCSVSQNDDEIHIKQLHVEELNILTQRINKTGFFIQSLALRTNSNNDAEYNLVLMFSHNAEGGVRRIKAVSGRIRTTSSDQLSDQGVSRSSQSRSLWHRMKGKHSGKRRLLPRIAETLGIGHTRPSSRTSGYLSDSALASSRRRSQLPIRRQVHSDDDVDSVDSRHAESTKVTLDHLQSSSTVPSRLLNTTKLKGTYEKTPSEMASTSYRSDWTQSSTKRNTPHTERRVTGPSGNAIPLRRSAMAAAKSELADAFESEAQSTSHSMSTTISNPLSPYGGVKRASRPHTTGSHATPPFRRHSPRKMIRKVYTGSSTIPKILNRKRPSGNPPVPNASQSNSVTSVSSSCMIPSNMSQTMSSMATTISSSTAPASASNVGHCLNNTSNTPAMVLEDSNRPLTSYPPLTSTTNVSVQYRRLPSVITPLAVVPTSQPSTDSIGINSPQVVTTASIVKSTMTDNKTAGVGLRGPIATTTCTSSSSMSQTIRTQVSALVEGEAKVKLLNSPNTKSTDVSSRSSTNVSDQPEEGGLSKSIVHTSNMPSTVIAPPSSSSSDKRLHTLCTPTVTVETKETNGPHILSIPQQVQHRQQKIPQQQHHQPQLHITYEADLNVDLDDVHTPANSLSASQLLKLKRLQDCHGGDSRPGSYFGQSSSRVKSPQLNRQDSQTQPNYAEHAKTSGTRPGGQTIVSQSCESLPDFARVPCAVAPPQPTAITCNKYGSGFCPISTSLNPNPLQVQQRSDSAIPPFVHYEEDDADDFELKTITRLEDGSSLSSPSSHAERSVPRSVSTRIASSVSSEAALASSLKSPLDVSAHLTPLMTPIAHGVSAIHRSTIPPTVCHMLSASSPHLTMSVSAPALPVVRDLMNPRMSSFDPHLPNQVATRVVVQNPNLNRAGDFPSHPIDLDLSTTPILPHVIPSMSTTISDSVSRPSTGLPMLAPGATKRTVVHKYHSFRKILPKSPEPSGQMTTASLGSNPNPPSFVNLASFAPNQTCLTQLPVVTNLYRSGSLPHTSSMNCEVATNDPTYIFDVGSTGLSPMTGVARPLEQQQAAAAAALGLSLVPNQAPQLLKSLLERGNSKESVGVVSTSTISSTASLTPPIPALTSSITPITTSIGPNRTWNQPAHQSRGTWQMGKRAATPSPRPTPPADPPVSTSSTGPTSRLTTPTPDHQHHTTGSSGLPSPIRLVPGSTSRLQQMQQHYQRHQRMQEEMRQAHRQSSDQEAAATGGHCELIAFLVCVCERERESVCAVNSTVPVGVTKPIVKY